MNIYSNKPPESLNPHRSAQTAQNVTGAEQKEKAVQMKNAAPADRVDISGLSKEIAHIMSAVNHLPDVRDNKVQEIKRRVDAGIYTVDPRKVAESILKSI